MEHLSWCYDQDPGNIWIPKLIVRARKQMLKIEDRGSDHLTQRQLERCDKDTGLVAMHGDYSGAIASTTSKSTPMRGGRPFDNAR